MPTLSVDGSSTGLQVRETSVVLDLQTPIPLDYANFTPRARTPWGGDYIASRLKQALVPELAGLAVGESWEFSCEADFPSKLLGTERFLYELFPDQSPCNLLVKLLDAKEALSIQVHPDDTYPRLGPDEAGKSESWFVLRADARAGVYLGFRDGVDAAVLGDALEKGNVADTVQFVPVAPGDYFEIPPGLCHGIGAGVTVLEPQHVRFGCKGKTYRLWDWNRHYDSEGRISSLGHARDLHIEDSLRLIDFERACGQQVIERSRKTPRIIYRNPSVTIRSYGDNPHYRTSIASCDRGSKLILSSNDYAAMLVLGGQWMLTGASGKKTYWQQGQAGFLPTESFPLQIVSLCRGQLCFVSGVGAQCNWESL